MVYKTICSVFPTPILSTLVDSRNITTFPVIEEIGGVADGGEEDGRVGATEVKARLSTHTLRARKVELQGNLGTVIKELSIGVRGGAIDLHSLSR